MFFRRRKASGGIGNELVKKFVELGGNAILSTYPKYAPPNSHSYLSVQQIENDDSAKIVVHHHHTVEFQTARDVDDVDRISPEVKLLDKERNKRKAS